MLTRHSLLTAFVALTLFVIVGLVILSPFALGGVEHFSNDWSKLSDVGQTYGAISAILSALALGGIVASLLYQARDSQIAHEQMTMTLQFELIKLELDDPALMSAIGAPWGIDALSNSDLVREFLYVQMWVSSWAASFVTGRYSEVVVRQLAAYELFRGRAGRLYWESAGKRQLAASKGRRNLFFRLLDDEYKKAVASDVSVEMPLQSAIDSENAEGVSIIPRYSSLRRENVAGIAVIVGMLIGWGLAVQRQRSARLG